MSDENTHPARTDSFGDYLKAIRLGLKMTLGMSNGPPKRRFRMLISANSRQAKSKAHHHTSYIVSPRSMVSPMRA
jgi:hypothetical protein